jgi:GH24 family phage-related lysozyme (muramidase)
MNGNFDRTSEHEGPYTRSSDVFLRIENRLWKNEDKIEYMYKDKNGNITVGIGFWLPDRDSAAKYFWRDRKTLRTAAKDYVKSQWDVISTKPKGFFASYYKTFTIIELSNGTIRSVFLNTLGQVHDMLREIFAAADFDTFPPPVQEALLDLAWNTATHNFESEWPELTKSAMRRDWLTAARESHRDSDDVPEWRNSETKELILQGIDFDRRL